MLMVNDVEQEFMKLGLKVGDQIIVKESKEGKRKSSKNPLDEIKDHEWIVKGIYREFVHVFRKCGYMCVSRSITKREILTNISCYHIKGAEELSAEIKELLAQVY